MTETTRSDAPSTPPFGEGTVPEGSQVARRLVDSAVESFARRGYHATTTRDISVGAGLSPAALYVHFKSKEEVLFEASRTGHRSVLDAVTEAAAGADGAVDRIQALVDSFVRIHAVHHTTCRVAQYELHALTDEHYREIAEIRRATDAVVRDMIQAGVDDGTFTVRDVPSAALAILSLGIDVARWYQPGRVDVDELTGNYVELVLAMLGAGARSS
ncbi:TetR/AcrR family transcriptional regulator [Rhodococcus chondri]|uniref:TetR/AcrR family transcriptional regulator n=1 Tax=Rhodococcus chondri TaxID=3065941 RepID=A0ABU7JT77_9NOCA|nr:TetR/AcrR family transcriptional regulator [Rhodococcus sp. CC-R104]MEE2033221.1 TetR/AcrR family transcriptional regulator [Rhodococcus sp. CC-R104]